VANQPRTRRRRCDSRCAFAGRNGRPCAAGLHSTISLARHRMELSGSLPGPHPPLAVPGQGRNFHTHTVTQSQEGAPWSSQCKKERKKLYFLATGSSRCRVRRSSMDGTIPNSDSAHKDLLSRLYLTQSDEVQYGIYFDLILYRVQFGQRSFIFPAKKIRVSDQIECTDLV
jgi:hypothetical protein